MRNRLLNKMTSRRGWELLFRERLAEPLHLNLLAIPVALFGSVRAKIYFDLIVRQQHAYGLLTAADTAREYGIKKITVIEFGVASGAGLMNLCKISEMVTRATGVAFSIVGFDTGEGLPKPVDHRDHPEYYSSGDYVMQKPDELRRILPRNVELIIGDVRDTAPEFIARKDVPPIGFVSIDVDYYSSTVDSLKALDGPPELYLPLVEVYLDDIGFPGHHPWGGELLAVNEFNEAHDLRKISPANFLREYRLFKRAKWISHMYRLHVLDHPARSTVKQGRVNIIGNPYTGVKHQFPKREIA
ncbi:MAG: hypothetical protein ACM3ZV_08075 [Bacillota bacterium]